MQIVVGSDDEKLQNEENYDLVITKKDRWRRTKKVFWGVLLLLGAVALLVNRMGFLEGFGFWSILFSAILVGTLVKGLAKRSFGEILFSLAFLVIVNDELLHLEAITPWPVLGAALLGTIGLNILFPRFGKGAHFTINGKKADIPSIIVKKGDVIALKDSSRDSEKIKSLLELMEKTTAPKWLDLDKTKASATVVALPERDDIDFPFQESLIVELYSK